MTTARHAGLPSPPATSAWRGFFALIQLTLRRQWRVRSLGVVTLLLVALIGVAVAIFTHGRVGWGFEGRWSPRYRTTYRDYPRQLAALHAAPLPAAAGATTLAAAAPFYALLGSPEFLGDYAFLNFSRWVIFGLFLGFLLPLVNLAFASGALGSEREGRTMIWLLTRPLPRSAIYLAKLFGVLPWCLLVSLGSLAAICLCGGALGREAFPAYAPAVALGSLAFSALFHLIGAIVRRPAVVGVVYVFFFETLVANLPGSLKQLSLNYYVRSLLYHEAGQRVRTVSPEALEIYAPAAPETCVAALLFATVGLTVLGMLLFRRIEPGEET